MVEGVHVGVVATRFWELMFFMFNSLFFVHFPKYQNNNSTLEDKILTYLTKAIKTYENSNTRVLILKDWVNHMNQYIIFNSRSHGFFFSIHFIF